MKRSFATISLLVVLALLILPACNRDKKGSAKSGDSMVLAKVGGKDITAADVNKLLDAQKAQMQGQPMDANTENMLKKRILDQLVDMQLLQQEAAREGLSVTDEEVNNEINGEVQRLGGMEKVNQLLQAKGLTLDTVKARIKESLLIQKLGKKVTDNIPPVSAEEAEKYFNENKQHFDMPESVHAYHILLLVDENAPEDKVKEAEAKINDIYKKAKKPGADFQALAKEFSEEPNAKESGGDLGSFGRGRMVQPFEDTAFATPVGQISKPIRSKFGFHVIKVTEHSQAGAKTFDQVKDNVVKMMTQKQKAGAFQKFIDDLRGKTKIEYPNPLPEVAAPMGMPGGPGGMPGMPPGTPNPHGGGMRPPPGGAPNPHGGGMRPPPGGAPSPHGGTPPPPPPPPGNQ